jgi:hypothetical protein
MELDDVFEDTGYRRNMEDQEYHMEKKRPFIHKKRIKLLRGDYRGEIKVLADEYADDLIKRGVAVEIREEAPF